MTHFIPLIASFLIISIAELGDKTQLLTLALAAKYPIKKVICGVFSAAAALMLLAVLVGGVIQRFVPMLFISILAGAFFIIYGLIMISPIKKEKEKEDHGKNIIRSKDPFWIVFGSFFLAELGDKTQLATFAMTAKYGTPVQIWIGATLGIVLVNLFGIMIGNVLRNYLPEKTINYFSGVVFIVFGALTFLSIIFKI
ncbi:MAG: TMEM165/GDT1 family protein [bacterium]